MNISFAGCGFLGIYHVGVASCFRKHAPHLIDTISGASAGALVGILLACEEIDLGIVTDDVLKTATKARARSLGPFHPGFNLHQILIDGMHQTLPEDAHLRASGRLHISLTRVSDRQNVMVSEFHNKEDLMDALLCSAFIPFYSGFLPPTFRGTRYVDGGISDNLPIIDKSCKTITVSPFSGEADICPRSDEFSDYLNFTISNTHIQITPSNLYRMCRALYPPEPSVLSTMCKQGFEDTLVYLKTHTLVPCERHVLKACSKSVCLGKPSVPSASSPSRSTSAERRRSLRASSNRLNTAAMPRWHISEDSEEEDDDDEDETDCMVSSSHRAVEKGEQSWHHWDDTDFFENRQCERCEHHSENLRLVKSLPPEVMAVLHSACHSLNPGMWNYITSSPLGRAVCLAFLPCVLPLETAFSIAIRLTKWLPHLRSDTKWFLSGLSSILQFIISNMEEIDIRKFEGQFSCRFGLQLQLEHMSALAGYPVTPQTSPDRANELLALDVATGAPPRRKLSFQFSMDVQAEALPDCVMDTFDLCDDLDELTLPRRHHFPLHCSSPSAPAAEGPPVDGNSELDSEYDSFDYTLKITNEMDDVLTYHYLRISQQVNVERGQGSVEIVEL